MLSLVALVLVASVAAVLWVGPSSSPGPFAILSVKAKDGSRYDLEVLRARPVAIDSTCSLDQDVALVGRGRLARSSSQDLAMPPDCIYTVVGRDSEDECLLEYSVAKPIGVAATGWSSTLAAVYYSKSQGGLVHFGSIDLPEKSFLMVDRRWCTVLGASPNLRLTEATGNEPPNQGGAAGPRASASPPALGR